jgi:hypothetical protein
MWVSAGKCCCLKHDDTYFMVEVESDQIPMDVIHEIEEAFEEGEYHVKLVHMLGQPTS